jgi:hypothetical protein
MKSTTEIQTFINSLLNRTNSKFENSVICGTSEGVKESIKSYI